jgi:hypothetical protein
LLGRLAWRLASVVALSPTASELAGLLAEPERLRVVAALVLGASTSSSVGEVAGLDTRSVATALARLEAGGLVERGADGTLVLLESAFRQAARTAAASAPTAPDPGEGHDAETAKVLRAFVRDGRLTALPTAESKKRVLLDVICQDVEPGRRYSEPEVNLVLRRWHDDVASLRRWLVDLGYLDRDAGEYWRSGGPVRPD